MPAYKNKLLKSRFSKEHKAKAVYLPTDTVDKLEKLVKHNIFLSVSDAIRSATIAMVQNLQFFLKTADSSHRTMVESIKEQLENGDNRWIIIDPRMFDMGRQSMIVFLKRNFPNYIRHRKKFYISRKQMEKYIASYDKYIEKLFKASCRT